MGTTIRGRYHAWGERRLGDQTSGPSGFGRTSRARQIKPDGAKTLHRSGSGLTTEKDGRDCSCDQSAGLATEWSLIDRILFGHRELFVDLIRPYQRTVYAMVFSLLSNKEDAEDVAQDAFVKALGSLNQFRRESAFGTWLIKIAINEARRRNRKQWRVRMFSLDHHNGNRKDCVPKDFEDWREIPSAALERAEVRQVLVKALGSLERHYREAFVMRDVQGLSVSETSAMLGISPGAVKTRLRRARLMLRDMLAPGLGQHGRLGWVSKDVRKPWG
jgi:RNA polymerase sigma-70 factor, ECF subfamily